MKDKLLTALIVLIIAFPIQMWTWGTLNADMDHGRNGEAYCNQRENRETLAVSALFSLIPPFWIASPFMTGFYQYGWSLRMPAECDGNK